MENFNFNESPTTGDDSHMSPGSSTSRQSPTASMRSAPHQRMSRACAQCHRQKQKVNHGDISMTADELTSYSVARKLPAPIACAVGFRTYALSTGCLKGDIVQEKVCLKCKITAETLFHPCYPLRCARRPRPEARQSPIGDRNISISADCSKPEARHLTMATPILVISQQQSL